MKRLKQHPTASGKPGEDHQKRTRDNRWLSLETLEPRALMAGLTFLQGTSYTDSNSNGEIDAGDVVKVGATIELYKVENNVPTLVDTEITNADGYYLFNNVQARCVPHCRDTNTGIDQSSGVRLFRDRPGLSAHSQHHRGQRARSGKPRLDFQLDRLCQSQRSGRCDFGRTFWWTGIQTTPEWASIRLLWRVSMREAARLPRNCFPLFAGILICTATSSRPHRRGISPTSLK